MDIDDNANDASSVSSLVLELAAHPLNSVNPPPCDLPDLLDNLIASEAEVRWKWVVCDQLIIKLSKRIPNLKIRLECLHQVHPLYQIDVAEPEQGRRAKQRMCFGACEEMYQRMIMQTSFMHYCLTRKIKPLIQQHMKAHKDILNVLLGDRHDHRGIESGKSEKLQCALGCEWYVEHGPYEWTKRPYTNEWWEEMNNTSWDWVRLRQHITNTIANAQIKAILAADMFLSNAQIYVPFWFWYDKYETWYPWIEVLPVQNEHGVAEERIVCKIRFEKNYAIIEKERLYNLEQWRGKRDKQEDSDGQGLVDDTRIKVDTVGERLIDPVVVFNGDAYSPDFNNGGQRMAIGCWLDWWGYRRWLNVYRSTIKRCLATNKVDKLQKAVAGSIKQRSMQQLKRLSDRADCYRTVPSGF